MNEPLQQQQSVPSTGNPQTSSSISSGNEASSFQPSDGTSDVIQSPRAVQSNSTTLKVVGSPVLASEITSSTKQSGISLEIVLILLLCIVFVCGFWVMNQLDYSTDFTNSEELLP